MLFMSLHSTESKRASIFPVAGYFNPAIVSVLSEPNMHQVTMESRGRTRTETNKQKNRGAVKMDFKKKSIVHVEPVH